MMLAGHDLLEDSSSKLEGYPIKKALFQGSHCVINQVCHGGVAESSAGIDVSLKPEADRNLTAWQNPTCTQYIFKACRDD